MTPVDPPKILGIPLTRTRGGFDCWIRQLHILLLSRPDGMFDIWISGFRPERDWLPLPDAIAAIERELLSIRAAIPESAPPVVETSQGTDFEALRLEAWQAFNYGYSKSSKPIRDAFDAAFRAGYEAKAEQAPLQPTNAELIATVRSGIGTFADVYALPARAALTELSRRLGGG